MSINQLSSSPSPWFNRGGNPVSERAAVQRQSNPSADAPGQAAKSEAPVRRNPLVAAVMEAMHSLVPASPPAAAAAAPATTAATATLTATDTATATPAPVDLKHLAYAFAHELYSALRGAGSGDDNGHARGGRPDNPGHQGHPGHHGVSNSAYGELAQRLEALAQSLGTAPAAPAAPAGAAATPSASALPTVAPTGTGTASAAAMAAPPPAAPAPAASPLLSAFKSLLSALAPKTTASTPGTDSASAKLTAFLHQMAQSLGLAGSEPASSLPASGGLLNTTA